VALIADRSRAEPTAETRRIVADAAVEPTARSPVVRNTRPATRPGLVQPDGARSSSWQAPGRAALALRLRLRTSGSVLADGDRFLTRPLLTRDRHGPVARVGRDRFGRLPGWSCRPHGRALRRPSSGSGWEAAMSWGGREGRAVTDRAVNEGAGAAEGIEAGQVVGRQRHGRDVTGAGERDEARSAWAEEGQRGAAPV
jgi:hypothetical protein